MRIAIVLRHESLLGAFLPHIRELGFRGHTLKIIIETEFWETVKEKIYSFKPDVIWTWNGRFSWYENLFYELRSYGFRIVVSEMAWLPQAGNHFICEFEDEFHRCEWAIRDDYPINHVGLNALKALYKVTKPNTGFNYILIPFQLESDTSITHLSSEIKHNSDTVSRAKELFPDKELLISMHPLQKDFPYTGPGKVYDGPCTTLDLAINAEWVVSINSTVTIETLLWHRNVIAFGKNVGSQVLSSGLTPQSSYKTSQVLSYLVNRQYRPEIVDGRVIQFIEGRTNVF